MSAYSGTDNLEIMTEAKNYNGFLVDLVIKSLGKRSSAQAVDFGAGIGTFARMVHERGLDVLCIEADPKQCAVIREHGFRAETNLENLPDGSAEYIYTLNVLEHIEDHQSALQLIARKLAPGGRLLIYVPAFQMLFSSMDRKVGHHRRYRRHQLMELVRGAGLRVVTARYADSLGFLATLAYKAIGSDKGDIDRRSVIVFDRFIFPLSRLCDVVFGHILGKNVYLVAGK
jgi:SAM-dependent methyltransferase